MATSIVTPTITDETSMSDLRAMIGGETKTAPAAEPEPEPKTSEPAEPDAAAATNPEPATEPGEKKTEPSKSDDEPELPEGVKKRIAKEVAKEAEIQREIDAAVSRRKAKEAELEKLKDAGQGSDPAPNTEHPATEGRPKRPQLGETGHDTETWEQFQTREAAYEDARDQWIRDQAVREMKETQTRETSAKAAQERWDAAVTKHGKEFPALMEQARKSAPEGLQVAISSLDNWDTVAVHLAKNPAQLQELAQAFETNPTKAIATLGRIEAALTSKESKSATTTETLPEPLKKVGGSASASGQDFQTMAESGSLTQLKAAVGKIRGKK